MKDISEHPITDLYFQQSAVKLLAHYEAYKNILIEEGYKKEEVIEHLNKLMNEVMADTSDVRELIK